MGGVIGALAERAEAIYQELSESQKITAQQVFTRLLSVTDEADDVRRRVRMTEIESLGHALTDVQVVVDTFGRERLLTFDVDPTTRGATVEVAHEALLREWPTLRDWVDSRRESLILQRRFQFALREWESNRTPANLVSGGKLSQYEEWAAGSGVTLAAAEREFLSASIGLRADETRQRRARRRRIMTGFAVVSVIALVIAAIAFDQRQEASLEAERAEVLAGRLLDMARQSTALAPDWEWAEPEIAVRVGESPPANIRLNFLFENCQGSDCFRDAGFGLSGAGNGIAYMPFHIRHGFVNKEGVYPDDGLARPGFELHVYVTRRNGPPLEAGMFEIDQTYRFATDYMVREVSTSCGPDYLTETEPQPCDMLVHDFPEGLPPGRYDIWVEWHAPCEAWGVADLCPSPSEDLSLFTSQVNNPFYGDGFRPADDSYVSDEP